MASKLCILLVILSIGGCVWSQDANEVDQMEMGNYNRPPPPHHGGEHGTENVEKYVSFYLYTNRNRHYPQVLRLGDHKSFKRSAFDPSCPTRILVHGWASNITTSGVSTKVKDAYLSVGEYNLIVMDWSPMANLFVHDNPPLVKPVARVLTRFLEYMTSIKYLKGFSKLHMTCYGFGSHICGIASRTVKDGPVGVIHALQPGGPGFWEGDEDSRISRDDAMYVQAIHTSVDYIGLPDAVGHVDIYPAYGRHQPACGSDRWCAHRICDDYFAEAIRDPKGFVAKQCSNVKEILKHKKCTETGLKVSMSQYPLAKKYHGVYYLPVRASPPYACGDI